MTGPESEDRVLELYLTALCRKSCCNGSSKSVSVGVFEAMGASQKDGSRDLLANLRSFRGMTRDPVMKNFSPLSTSNPFNLTAAELRI